MIGETDRKNPASSVVSMETEEMGKKGKCVFERGLRDLGWLSYEAAPKRQAPIVPFSFGLEEILPGTRQEKKDMMKGGLLQSFAFLKHTKF